MTFFIPSIFTIFSMLFGGQGATAPESSAQVDCTNNYELICAVDESYLSTEIGSVQVLYDQTDKNVFVYESQDDKIYVKEYVYSNRALSEYATITFENGELSIRGSKSVNHYNCKLEENEHLDIYLPNDYSGVLNVLTSSGSINLTHSLSSVSDPNLKTASGSIKSDLLENSNAILTTSSGSIKMDQVNGGVKCETQSGAISISSGVFYGAFNTRSGSVNLSASAILGDIDATTMSGAIKAYIASTDNFNYQLSTRSGRIKNDFGSSNSGAVNGGGNNLTFMTRSGGISLLYN